MKDDTLLKQIEDTRRELYALVQSKAELTDSEVVKLSKQLDALLNEYQRRIAVV